MVSAMAGCPDDSAVGGSNMATAVIYSLIALVVKTSTSACCVLRSFIVDEGTALIVNQGIAATTTRSYPQLKQICVYLAQLWKNYCFTTNSGDLVGSS